MSVVLGSVPDREKIGSYLPILITVYEMIIVLDVKIQVLFVLYFLEAECGFQASKICYWNLH